MSPECLIYTVAHFNYSKKNHQWTAWLGLKTKANTSALSTEQLRDTSCHLGSSWCVKSAEPAALVPARHGTVHAWMSSLTSSWRWFSFGVGLCGAHVGDLRTGQAALCFFSFASASCFYFHLFCQCCLQICAPSFIFLLPVYFQFLLNLNVYKGLLCFILPIVSFYVHILCWIECACFSLFWPSVSQLQMSKNWKNISLRWYKPDKSNKS